MLDLDTIGYFLFMEEQERQELNRQNTEDKQDDEEEAEKGLYYRPLFDFH